MNNPTPILPLPQFPKFSSSSPNLVQVLDTVRFALDSEEYGEFYWFAREYPRIYRYHLNHAEYRLKTIYSVYQKFHSALTQKVQAGILPDEQFEQSIGANFAYQVYWDFESYLSALNTALDVLARIVGTAYKEQLPPSFNKLCKKENLAAVAILQESRNRWVSQLKNYRDCFVHYTPVDNLVFITWHKYSDGWEVRCALPVNPNSREMLRFKYSRRVELLKYSIATWKNMQRLDKAVASFLSNEFSAGRYPQRINGLFFIGARDQSES